jgi:hypothetical protein
VISALKGSCNISIRAKLRKYKDMNLKYTEAELEYDENSYETNSQSNIEEREPLRENCRN